MALWHLFSFLTILWAGIWAFIVALRKGRFKEILPAVWSIVVIVVVASFVMPTIGKSHMFMYRRKANSVASAYLNRFNQTPGARDLGGTLTLHD